MLPFILVEFIFGRGDKDGKKMRYMWKRADDWPSYKSLAQADTKKI